MTCLPIVLLVGCTTAPALPDLFQSADYRNAPGIELRYVSKASIVVLGKVTGARPVGRPRAAREDPSLLIQLTRITLQAEMTLKGSLPRNTIYFYYYTFSERNTQDLGVYHYLPSLGERRIFFLRNSDGEYRSVGDVTDYTLPVRSGFHEPNICQAGPLGCCIARILLTPGKGYDSESFVLGLTQAVYAAKVLCSRATALDFLEELSRSPDERIAERARKLLAAESADS
jgi:hypothetical protein